MAYRKDIDLIRDGENVEAAVPNRPLTQLSQNIDYIKTIVDAANLGKALSIKDQPCDSSVQVGFAVYWDDVDAKFKPAKASVYVDTTTGILKPNTESEVWGIVYNKPTSTTADILIAGSMSIDMSAATSSTSAGIYFLSATDPGKLVSDRPNVRIPVAQLGPPDSAGNREVKVIVNYADSVDRHTHFYVELQPVPAGTHTPPAPGNSHVITNPDPNIEGWLPASSFGNAPAGAKFGYNIAKASWANLWPPLPLDAAIFEWHKPGGAETSNVGFVQVPDAFVQIDENGIWWMTDCYGEVPWPTDYDTNNPPGPPASGCPTDLRMATRLWFTRHNFFTDDTVVTSLTARSGSGLAVYCKGTNDVADSGALELDFDLSTLLGSTTTAGHIVFKELNNGAFDRGPVVEAIKSNSPNVTITSNVSQGPNGENYGIVTIDAAVDVNNSEFAIDTVRLDGAEQEFYQDVLAIGFSKDRPASIRGRVIIPKQVSIPVGATMKFRFIILGRSAGSIPSDLFTLTYRILPYPTSNTALPTSDTSLTLDCTGTLSNADEYYAIESGTINIASGDIILFTLSRNAPDSYNGDVHVLWMSGVPSS